MRFEDERDREKKKKYEQQQESDEHWHQVGTKLGLSWHRSDTTVLFNRKRGNITPGNNGKHLI